MIDFKVLSLKKFLKQVLYQPLRHTWVISIFQNATNKFKYIRFTIQSNKLRIVFYFNLHTSSRLFYQHMTGLDLSCSVIYFKNLRFNILLLEV